MENKNELEKILAGRMSVDESGVADPSPLLVSNARKIIASKKKSDHKEDVFFMVAKFLNLKIKLSYAVVFILTVSVGSFYFIKENDQASVGMSSPYIVNIASARSSTVLSSIITFESKR